MTQWSYLVATWITPQQMDSYGLQGWELITVTDNGTFYFKRPLHNGLRGVGPWNPNTSAT